VMISTTDKRLQRFELPGTERCMPRSSDSSSPYMTPVAYSIEGGSVSPKWTIYCSFWVVFRVSFQNAGLAQFCVHAFPEAAYECLTFRSAPLDLRLLADGYGEAKRGQSPSGVLHLER
jgi:hypothetical protein